MDNFNIKRIDEVTYASIFSKKLYEEAAILNAAYNYSKYFYVKLCLEDSDNVTVKLRIKDNIDNNDAERLVLEFSNEVLEQQLRLDVNSRTSKLSELIYAKAFSPIQNIEG